MKKGKDHALCRKDLAHLVKRISVSLTEKEYEKISEIAKAAGISRSDVLRRYAIGARLPEAKIDREYLVELQKLRSQIASLGGLIKNRYNLNPVYEEETAALLRAQCDFLLAVQREFEVLRDKQNIETRRKVI